MYGKEKSPVFCKNLTVQVRPNLTFGHWTGMWHQFKKERCHSIVTSLTIAVSPCNSWDAGFILKQSWKGHIISIHEIPPWVSTLPYFMKVRSLFNLTFVVIILHKMPTGKNILHQFMKRRNHSNAIFVFLHLQKKVH